MSLTIFFLILLSIIVQFVFLFYIDSSPNSVQFRNNKTAKLKSRIRSYVMRMRSVRKLFDHGLNKKL